MGKAKKTIQDDTLTQALILSLTIKGTKLLGKGISKLYRKWKNRKKKDAEPSP
jgi:hypothetical protein